MKRASVLVLGWVLASASGCVDEGSGSASGDGDGDSGANGSAGDGDGDDDGMAEGGDGGGCADGPLDAPIAGCTPTPVPDSGDFHRDCVDRINQFRWECQCLPPLERWTEAEGCTDAQSATDQSNNDPHGAFGDCGESAQNTCPNWPDEDNVVGGCLQLMWDEGPGEDFNAHGHYINMSNPAYTKVACGKASGGNGVWSNQNFAR